MEFSRGLATRRRVRVPVRTALAKAVQMISRELLRIT